MFLSPGNAAPQQDSYSEYLATFTAPRNGECMGGWVGAATGTESFSDLACKKFKPMLVCSKATGGISSKIPLTALGVKH